MAAQLSSHAFGLVRTRLTACSPLLALHGYGEYTVTEGNGDRQTYDARYLTDLRFGYNLGFGTLSIGANNLFNVTPEKKRNRPVQRRHDY